jgi:uncharacterized membrane protein YhaH (DUF805 family)
MAFLASVKSAFVNWRDYSGRATRPEYWYFTLFVVLCNLPFQLLKGVGGDFFASGSSSLQHLFGFISVALSLVLVVPHLAVGVRRLHDTEHSGWTLAVLGALFLAAFVLLKIIAWVGVLFVVIAVISDIVVLVWFCENGTNGSNRFGPPRDPVIAAPVLE